MERGETRPETKTQGPDIQNAVPDLIQNFVPHRVQLTVLISFIILLYKEKKKRRSFGLGKTKSVCGATAREEEAAESRERSRATSRASLRRAPRGSPSWSPCSDQSFLMNRT